MNDEKQITVVVETFEDASTAFSWADRHNGSCCKCEIGGGHAPIWVASYSYGDQR